MNLLINFFTDFNDFEIYNKKHFNTSLEMKSDI